MRYTKPEVTILGKAVRVIDFLLAIKGRYVFVDVLWTRIDPAYDLDE